MKYAPDGTALWARATISGANVHGRFWDVAVDGSDNVYAVGYNALKNSDRK